MNVTGDEGYVLEPVNVDDVPGTFTELIRSSDTFALRVRGNGIVKEQFRDGDLLLVQSNPPAQEGDTVLALVRGESTVKRLHLQNGRIMLQPTDERAASIEAEKDVQIRGVVVAVIRKY